MTTTVDVLGAEVPSGPGVRTARIIPNRVKSTPKGPVLNSPGEIEEPEEDDPFLPTEEQLAMINKLTLRKFEANELWVVKILGCDNQPDRHYDRILVPAINQLAPTFIGRAGLSDHRWSSTTQTSRIFNAYVNVDTKVESKVPGEPYTHLVFEQYMLRTEGNAEFRLEIEAGIKKETSVGFLLNWLKVTCSVCGDSLWGWDTTCPHIPGRTYSQNGVDQVCLGLIPAHEGLEGVENSWVAVPAQPRAGAMQTQKDAEGDELRRQLVQRKEKLMEANQLVALLGSAEARAQYLSEQPEEVRKQLEDAFAALTMSAATEDPPPPEPELTPPAPEEPATASAPAVPVRLELDTKHFEAIGKQITEAIAEAAKSFDEKLENATAKAVELEAQVKELTAKLEAQLAEAPGGPLVAGFVAQPSAVPPSTQSNKNAAGGELGNRVIDALMADLPAGN